MKTIESAHNTRFKCWKKWAENAQLCQKENQLLLEGAHLIALFLEKNKRLDCLIIKKNIRLTEEIHAIIAQSNEVFCLPDDLFKKISNLKNSSGLLAITKWAPKNHLALDFSQNSVLLDGVQNPLNVGAILRVAAASGFNQILLSQNCAHAFSMKALRAAQGCHFLLTIFEKVDLLAFVEKFQGGVFAATPHQHAVSLFSLRMQFPSAWIFGSEGQGISKNLLLQAQAVEIPMQNGVESLNVASAAALCLFEGFRHRF